MASTILSRTPLRTTSSFEAAQARARASVISWEWRSNVNCDRNWPPLQTTPEELAIYYKCESLRGMCREACIWRSGNKRVLSAGLLKSVDVWVNPQAPTSHERNWV